MEHSVRMLPSLAIVLDLSCLEYASKKVLLTDRIALQKVLLIPQLAAHGLLSYRGYWQR